MIVVTVTIDTQPGTLAALVLVRSINTYRVAGKLDETR